MWDRYEFDQKWHGDIRYQPFQPSSTCQKKASPKKKHAWHPPAHLKLAAASTPRWPWWFFHLEDAKLLNVHSKPHPFKGKMGVLKFEDAQLKLIMPRYSLCYCAMRSYHSIITTVTWCSGSFWRISIRQRLSTGKMSVFGVLLLTWWSGNQRMLRLIVWGAYPFTWFCEK